MIASDAVTGRYHKGSFAVSYCECALTVVLVRSELEPPVISFVYLKKTLVHTVPGGNGCAVLYQDDNAVLPGAIGGFQIAEDPASRIGGSFGTEYSFSAGIVILK